MRFVIGRHIHVNVNAQTPLLRFVMDCHASYKFRVHVYEITR